MPKLSEFFGIAIYMYWGDHGPPHFHARYGGEKASIAIADLSVVAGGLSPRALGLVVEWASPSSGRTGSSLAESQQERAARPNSTAEVRSARCSMT